MHFWECCCKKGGVLSSGSLTQAADLGDHLYFHETWV